MEQTERTHAQWYARRTTATAASRHGRKGVYCLLRAGDSDIAWCSVGVPVSMHPVPRCGCGVDGHALSFFSQTRIQNEPSNVPCAVERVPIFIFKIQNMYVAFPEGVTLYGNTPHSPASRPWRID